MILTDRRHSSGKAVGKGLQAQQALAQAWGVLSRDFRSPIVHDEVLEQAGVQGTLTGAASGSWHESEAEARDSTVSCDIDEVLLRTLNGIRVSRESGPTHSQEPGERLAVSH